MQPNVLLMDEPCSALDPTSTRRIEDTIAELRDRVTVVIVTHNMQQAHRVSDHCAFFLAAENEPGRVVEHGPDRGDVHRRPPTRARSPTSRAGSGEPVPDAGAWAAVALAAGVALAGLAPASTPPPAAGASPSAAAAAPAQKRHGTMQGRGRATWPRP